MPCRAIVLTYEIDDHIADAALRLASENGIEVVVDKDDDCDEDDWPTLNSKMATNHS